MTGGQAEIKLFYPTWQVEIQKAFLWLSNEVQGIHVYEIHWYLQAILKTKSKTQNKPLDVAQCNDI